MQRTLIVEPHSGGHVLVFVRLLVQECQHRGVSPVLALSPDVRATPEFALHLADVAEACTFVVAPTAITPASIAELASRTGSSKVVIPDGDPYVALFARRRYRGPSVTLLIMRDPAWTDPGSSLKMRTKARAKQCALAILERRRRVNVLRLRAPGFRDSGDFYVNDPMLARLDPSASATWRRERGVGEDRYWFGIAGHITRRKNPGRVMEALGALDPKAVGLLVAGSVQEDTVPEFNEGLTRLASLGVPVVHQPGPLSDADLNVAIGAMDCVVVAYDTTAPPSSMGKAYTLGAACIVAGPPALQRQASFLDFATTCDSSLDSLSTAMGLNLKAGRKGRPRDVPAGEHFADRLI